MTTCKKALITGRGRGIGAVVARELAARSIELVALNRSRGTTEKLIESLSSSINVTPYYIA